MTLLAKVLIFAGLAFILPAQSAGDTIMRVKCANKIIPQPESVGYYLCNQMVIGPSGFPDPCLWYLLMAI